MGKIVDKLINRKKFKPISGVAVLLLSVVFVFLFSENVQGYTEGDLYNEKLQFDTDGTLVMTTHDKKATTNIRYRTVGWVIKRYDMPADAYGQQYVMLPMDVKVINRDDPKDSAYIYSTYYGNKDRLTAEIEKVSKIWKNQLYSYGDYVYIDEILTIVEYGVPCGGINSEGKLYGEVYYDYTGISNARKWASKESLKTHFNKSVYFPAQVTPTVYSKEVKKVDTVRVNSLPKCQGYIGEGTKYANTYDLKQAVPTGSSVYFDGQVSRFYYDVYFYKMQAVVDFPVKIVTNYTLKWKAYDGSIRQEKKSVTNYYTVRRTGTYYLNGKKDVMYLTGVSLYNNALGGRIERSIEGSKPSVTAKQNESYYNHVVEPEYKDVYYVSGGTISQMNVNGVKPTIPVHTNQSLAEKYVGQLMVKNDYLKIGNKVFLNNAASEKTSSAPLNTEYSATTVIYFTGMKIPDTVKNSMVNLTSGYYVYKSIYSEKEEKRSIGNLSYINIHTPVCISGKAVAVNEDTDLGDAAENNKTTFKIIADYAGQHIDKKGYGYKDYKDMVALTMVKFSADMFKDGELLAKDTWTVLDEDSTFGFVREEDELNAADIDVNLVAFSRNYGAVSNYSELVENIANLSLNNYGAFSTFKLVIENTPEKSKGEVVGTH